MIPIEDFVCKDPTNREISQAYMDLIVAYEGKKPAPKEREFIYELLGGEARWREINDIIKDQVKLITKNFKDMKPKKVRDDLEDLD